MIFSVVIQGLRSAHDHVATLIVKVGLAKGGFDGLFPRVAVGVGRAAPFNAGSDIPDRIVCVTPREAAVSLDPMQIIVSDADAADVGNVGGLVVAVVFAQDS